MLGSISSPSLLALIFYVVVASATGYAATLAKVADRPAWHSKSWMVLTVFFCVLMASRLFNLEDLLREILRDIMRENGLYESRANLQLPIVLFSLVIAGAAGFWLCFRIAQRLKRSNDYAVSLAIAAGMGLAFLYTLRIISLHVMDRLLYGPLKLNWIGDMGASILTFGCALYYVRLLRSQGPRGRR